MVWRKLSENQINLNPWPSYSFSSDSVVSLDRETAVLFTGSKSLLFLQWSLSTHTTSSLGKMKWTHKICIVRDTWCTHTLPTATFSQLMFIHSFVFCLTRLFSFSHLLLSLRLKECSASYSWSWSLSHPRVRRPESWEILSAYRQPWFSWVPADLGQIQSNCSSENFRGGYPKSGTALHVWGIKPRYFQRCCWRDESLRGSAPKEITTSETVYKAVSIPLCQLVLKTTNDCLKVVNS